MKSLCTDKSGSIQRINSGKLLNYVTCTRVHTVLLMMHAYTCVYIKQLVFLKIPTPEFSVTKKN